MSLFAHEVRWIDVCLPKSLISFVNARTHGFSFFFSRSIMSYTPSYANVIQQPVIVGNVFLSIAISFTPFLYPKTTTTTTTTITITTTTVFGENEIINVKRITKYIGW